MLRSPSPPPPEGELPAPLTIPRSAVPSQEKRGGPTAREGGGGSEEQPQALPSSGGLLPASLQPGPWTRLLQSRPSLPQAHDWSAFIQSAVAGGGNEDQQMGLNEITPTHHPGDGQENSRQSALFFSKACEAGHSEGCFNLGYLFQHGIGCPRDHALATRVQTAGVPLLFSFPTGVTRPGAAT